MIHSLAYFLARVLRRIARVLENLGGVQDIVVRRAMAAHDMVSQPDEPFYLELYWNWLLPQLAEHFPDRRARVLDIGCGQGRLTLPLAEWLTSGSVVGIDLTPEAIEKARAYLLQQGLKNVEFQLGDALQYLKSQPSESLEIALMLEVSVFMPSYREAILEIARVLKKGGLCFISFRSQYFDLLHSVRSRDWQSARLVCEAREGHWGGGVTWFSWHTVADIHEILIGAGLVVKNCYGIGVASGIEGDPLSFIAQPSRLPSDEKTKLMEIENSLAVPYAQCGRYILAVAVKAD